MEKDKFRSVVRVGVLACSMLMLSALFMGCPKVTKPTTAPTGPGDVRAPADTVPVTCAHTNRVAFYHHQLGEQTHEWTKDPAIVQPDGVPVPQPCPVDPAAICNADSLKCNDCGIKLWP